MGKAVQTKVRLAAVAIMNKMDERHIPEARFMAAIILQAIEDAAYKANSTNNPRSAKLDAAEFFRDGRCKAICASLGLPYSYVLHVKDCCCDDRKFPSLKEIKKTTHKTEVIESDWLDRFSISM